MASLARSSIVLFAVTGAIVGSPGTAVAVPPEWEPTSYDLDPNDYPVRVATPEDSQLERNEFGDVGISWWWLKDPQNPQRMIVVVEAEPFWGQRAIGKGGPFMWAVGQLSYEKAPQLPFMNGILSFKDGLPAGGWADWATADGKPGMRGSNYSINYAADTNSWQVKGFSPLAAADFTATEPVAGPHGLIKVGGDPGTDSLMDEIVLNSRATGSVTIAGRQIDITGWRAGYWRMRMFGSVVDSILDPNKSWAGWEYAPVMEPDGGASEFYGIMRNDGRYSGPLIDARPSGTRICSKTTLEFGDYKPGRPMVGQLTPPFTLHTIPGWIKVKCAPGQEVQMEKTFYTDSTDYVSAGWLDGTEMPVHTVPGSFGTYEHFRWAYYKMRPQGN
ncbi:hypothetical protein F5X71_19760 [Nocardia brasiliensis]|uniref:Secreted protein n=1 Tax=Nocardia brasiliensis TaxID=37326 RepID=A0A6G9XTV1_NOCBR|nr:hypothetical protein [Nocardia brasiliensis]QIS04270.1 hypothetical protein F5X71_19760 [Nocardia brasiliensis]